jgi:hypothetical protein
LRSYPFDPSGSVEIIVVDKRSATRVSSRAQFEIEPPDWLEGL